MSTDRAGWVYILDDQMGHYKIGKARDLSERIKQLKILLPFPVVLHYAIKVDDRHQIERFLHSHYGKFRINGEWFALTLDAIAPFYEAGDFSGTFEAADGSYIQDEPMRIGV